MVYQYMTKTAADRWHLRVAIFAAIPSLICAVLLFITYLGLGLNKSREQLGKDLNKRAWEASFSERGLSVPAGGPRDGYWQSDLKAKQLYTSIGWKESPQHKPELLEIDDDGWQYWRSRAEPTARVLILGGSVAFGAYASSIDATYFSVLGRGLEDHGFPIEMKLLTAAAWKSRNELPALDIERGQWDVIMFLNGANDLSLTHDNDFYSESYMSGRVHSYLMHMRRAAEISKERRSTMLVVLQPFLFDRQKISPIERELFRASLTRDSSPAELFRGGYAAMRLGLIAMSEAGDIQFFDASRIFDIDDATTFSDLWHFSDPGQAILGQSLVEPVERAIESKRP